MAEFKINKQQADVIQNADQIQNHNPAESHGEFDGGLPEQLDALRSLIERAVRSHDLDRVTGARLATAIKAADDEAQASQPRFERIIAGLGDARDIAASVLAPMVVAAIENVVTTLTG
jgi:hypothetical protein